MSMPTTAPFASKSALRPSAISRVSVPGPGCSSDGESPQEALANVYDAIVCWMEAAKEMGREVPEPKRSA